MKLILPLILCSLVNIGIHAQCVFPSAFEKMETPRLSVMHNSGSSLWWDGTGNESITINDSNISDSPTRALLAGGLWFAARDMNGTLYTRTTEYGLNQNYGAFNSGPITADFPNLEICKYFNKVWEVQKSEIDAFRQDWNANQSIDNPIPNNIKYWPGRGNSYILNELNIPLPDMKLAPFIDLNLNGIYEVDKGDFPDIRNANIGHWWMFNDNGVTATGSPKIVIADFAILAYSFDDDNSTSSTIYYELEAVNRSSVEFAEMHLGLWADSYLGCISDEVIGSQPEENLIYIYNSQETKQCFGGLSTTDFDLGSPLVGIKILDGNRFDPNLGWLDNGLSSFTYFKNPSIGNPLPGTLDPINSLQDWNYLTGYWKDGTPYTSKGDGYNPNSTDYTKYAFSGAPNDPDGWSQCTADLEEQDRRMVMGSGPFNIASGDSQKFSFALIITEAIPDFPCPSLDPLLTAANAAQEVYDGIVAAQHPEPIDNSTISIFPNPTGDLVNINLSQGNIDEINVFDSQGKLIQMRTAVDRKNVQLSLNDLSKGLYILSIKNQNGQIHNHRIVKI